MTPCYRSMMHILLLYPLEHLHGYTSRFHISYDNELAMTYKTPKSAIQGKEVVFV